MLKKTFAILACTLPLTANAASRRTEGLQSNSQFGCKL